jgi:hypothetical protein
MGWGETSGVRRKAESQSEVLHTRNLAGFNANALLAPAGRRNVGTADT